MLTAIAVPPVMTASRCSYATMFTCRGSTHGGVAATATTTRESTSAIPSRSGRRMLDVPETVAALAADGAKDAMVGESGARGSQVEPPVVAPDVSFGFGFARCTCCLGCGLGGV
jgi:hypothetical protein